MGLPSGCGLRFGFAAFGRAHVESAYPDTGASQSSRHPQHIAERAEPLKPGYYQDIELSVPCQLQHAADGCRRTFALRKPYFSRNAPPALICALAAAKQLVLIPRIFFIDYASPQS